MSKIGTPKRLAVQKKVTAADLQRFMAKVVIDQATGCWLWQGTKDCHGYGSFWWNGQMRWAHRFSLAAFKADIPRGHDADHADVCRNPSCVAPFHLNATHRKDHGRRHQPEAAAATAVPF